MTNKLDKIDASRFKYFIVCLVLCVCFFLAGGALSNNMDKYLNISCILSLAVVLCVAMLRTLYVTRTDSDYMDAANPSELFFGMLYHYVYTYIRATVFYLYFFLGSLCVMVVARDLLGFMNMHNETTEKLQYILLPQSFSASLANMSLHVLLFVIGVIFLVVYTFLCVVYETQYPDSVASHTYRSLGVCLSTQAVVVAYIVYACRLFAL